MGVTVPATSGYHQLITNAFRKRWPYGSAAAHPEELQRIMLEVDTAYPIPQLIGIPNP
jgi:hypothetical protein